MGGKIRVATLRELHDLRGNPDFSHWNTVKLFSVAEASLLTAGLEPCEYNHLADYDLRQKLLNEKPINWQHALMLIRSIIEAICTHEIKSPFIKIDRSDYNNQWDEVIEQAKLSIDDTSSIIASETKIHRDELHKWLTRNGYFSQPRQANIEVVQKNQPQQANEKEILLLPEPTYTTPALEAINGVIREFWISYDPDKNQPPPKQNVVKAWIAENHPELDSDYIQTAIDKICRHPNAKNGGNRKINP